MAEYIEREVAVKAILDKEDREIKNDYEFCLGLIVASNAVSDVPAADVQPARHGRWDPDYDYTEYDLDGSTLLSEPRKFQDGWQCSLCGQYTPSKTNYCPNCGAKMDTKEQEAVYDPDKFFGRK